MIRWLSHGYEVEFLTSLSVYGNRKTSHLLPGSDGLDYEIICIFFKIKLEFKKIMQALRKFVF